MESARLDLAEHYSFESVVGFNRIDVDYIGELDPSDIKAFCEDNGIKCSLNEAARLIDQYDENGNGRLSYAEFCQLILPSTNDHLRSVVKSREAEYRYIKSAFLSKPVEKALATLFQKEVEYQRSIEEVRIELNGRSDFNAQKCFESIDKAYPYKKIDRNEIRDFVAEYYTILSEDDLDAIIRRCDTDEDEQISQQEFKDVVRHIEINPIMKKFVGGIKRSSIYDSPTTKHTWRDIYSRFDDRDSKLNWNYLYSNWRTPYTGSRWYSDRYWYRNGYNYDDYSPLRYSRYAPYRHSRWNSLSYNKYNTPNRLSWRNFSPNRFSWRHYSPRYRSHWRDGSYLRKSLNDPDYDIRDIRYSFLDPIIRGKRNRSFTRTLTPKRAKSSSPMRLSTSFSRDTYPMMTTEYSPPMNRVSSRNFNYRTSRSPFMSRKDELKNLLYDGLRERLSTSPGRRLKTNVEYAPARRSLRSRFDIAEELVEEDRIPVKEGRRLSSKNKSMRTTHTLNTHNEGELFDSLKDLIEIDKELERAKQALALKGDFTLHNGFKVFDYEDNGFATLDDIMEAFEIFHIYPKREEARLFLARYDQNKTNALGYPEFCEAFVPLNKNSADILRGRSSEFPHGYYRRRDEFSQSTIDAFARVLKLHLEVETSAEILRQKHVDLPKFRYDDAFTTLNQWGDDYLSVREFKEFFQKYGYFPTADELEILVDRFDKDHDGKVSYDEFFDEFSPHSNIKI